MSSKPPLIASLVSALILLIELLLFGLMLLHAMMANAGWEGSTIAGFERLYWIAPIIGIVCTIIAITYVGIGKRPTAFKWWAASICALPLEGLILFVVENSPVVRGH